MSYKGNYLKAIVIVHGKSEFQMCDFIKRKLKPKIYIISKDNGKHSIQITSIMKRLNGKDINTLDNFINTYKDDLEIKNNKTIIDKDFKIFIIMDTDDCKEEEKINFINKNMFKNHWAYAYIVPIYNITNLEDVLIKAKVIDKNTIKNKKDKKNYKIKIFPITKQDIETDVKQIEEFYQKLLKVKDISNMHEFIKFCLDNRYVIK